MIRFLLFSLVLLTLSGSAARAQSREFDDLLLSSWQYSAISVNGQAILRINGQPLPTNRPLTRYEFAVAITQRVGKFPFEENPKIRDVVLALTLEFASEIQRVKERAEDISDFPRVTTIDKTISPPLEPSTSPLSLRRGAETPKTYLPESFLRRKVKK